MDGIAVFQLHGGNGDGAEMVFSFYGRLISVSISPSNGSSTKDTLHLGSEDRPLQDHLTDSISRAIECKYGDEYEKLVDETLDIILDAGKPHFSSLQAAAAESNQHLSHFLFPEFTYFRLDAPARDVFLVPISADEGYTIHTIDPALDEGFVEELEIYQDVPRYTSEEIVVTEVYLRGATSVNAAVQVQGQNMLCKAKSQSSGLFGTFEGREIECLGKILKAFPQKNTIRVPQLLGYIHHKDTRQILGCLQQWIPGRRLSNIDLTIATAEQRQKWASQISETIESLHKHDLVWGDAKPYNIIIDEQDNAWLVEFGGGYSRGWIDQELCETKEGDKQALAKIIELLIENKTEPSSS